MKLSIRSAIAVTVFLFHNLVFAAGDPLAGEKKSITCVSCHGKDGIGMGPLWPNLAGQKSGYLVKTLKDFREGRRVEPMMTAFVSDLSDDDIEDLAAYFAQLNAK